MHASSIACFANCRSLRAAVTTTVLRFMILLRVSGAGPDLAGVSATVSDGACRKIGRLIPYRFRTHSDRAEALITYIPLVPVRAGPEHNRTMRDHQGLSLAATHLKRIRPRLRSSISRNPKHH